MKRLHSAVRALEYENKRLKEQMSGMVTILQLVKDLPRRGAYLIGKPDGTLLCSGKKPLNLAQVAGAMLEVEGCATVTIFRLIPWRSVEVSTVTREWREYSNVNTTSQRIPERGEVNQNVQQFPKSDNFRGVHAADTPRGVKIAEIDAIMGEKVLTGG